MNNNQRFDDHIKEQFKNYSPDVQPHIWENIVAKRKRKKPVGFWFTFFNGRNILILAAVLLAAGSGAYFLLKDNSAKNNNTIIAADKQNTNAPVATNDNTNTAEKNNTTSRDINDNTTANANTVPGVNDNAVNASVGGDEKTADNNFTNLTNSGKLKTSIRASTAQEDNDVAVTKKGKKKNGTAYSDYTISDADVLYATQSSNATDLKRLDFVNAENIFSDKKMATLKARAFPNVYLPDCPSIEKNAAGNKTYIEVYGGPDKAFRSLSDTGNSAYLQKRKESTKFSSAFSAGVRYTKVFNNGMSIRTGLNYSQINEKFTLVQGNVVQVTYIINAAGDTTGSYTTTGTRYKTTYNKFKTIDIPVLVGYELGNGRLHANINAGVMVNIYSWQKGDVLDMSGNPVSITTGKGGTSAYQFKTNIGMAFMTSASFYYKLNDKLHLLAEPYYRYNLAPMSNETLTLKQKYNTAGLRVGIRVDLH